MIPFFYLAILALANSIGSTAAQGDENCPFACPEGWTRFGFSENCYKLPAQPAKLDTFWNHDKLCKDMEPTSYVMVVNSLLEQAAGSAVALQYTFNWFAVLLNGFIWLGGYTTPNGWKFLDGTDQTGSVLMIGAGLIGSQKNGTCLGADAKTLGLWQTRPCDDNTGTAICEMPRRRVCGPTGGILPISPISLSPCSIFELFPKMPSIPFIGPLLGDSLLGNTVNSAGSGISNWLGLGTCNGGSGKPTSTPPPCPTGCPSGWFSWSNSPNDHCYRQPDSTQLDTFWNMQDKCRKLHPKANVLVINTLLELSAAMGFVRDLEVQNPFFRKVDQIWFGAYTTDSGWRFLDGSGGNFLSAVNDMRPPVKNGTCLMGDLKDLSHWRAVPCSWATASAYCELPKQTACSGLDGSIISVSPVELTPEKLKDMFPTMPLLPGLDEILGLTKTNSAFNASQAAKNNQTGATQGDAVAGVMCLKPASASFFNVANKPDWIWLTIGGDDVSVPGTWVQQKCSSGIIDVFRVQASTYLSLWTRCRLAGYEVVMPANSYLSGWFPYQVQQQLAEYYRQDLGTLGLLAYDYSRVPLTDISKC